MKTHQEKPNSKLTQSEKGFLSLSQKPALIDKELTSAVEVENVHYGWINDTDEKKSVSVVLNYGIFTPKSFPFDPYEAYKIRLVSFANGAIYAIKNGTQRDKLQKIMGIKNILGEKIQELENFKHEMNGDNNVSFGSELYQFYNKDLPKISGLKPKEIAFGEAMYVWQEVPRPTRVTSYLRPLNIDKKCDLISMPLPPTENTLANLPIQSNAAYVQSGNQIFYVNKYLKKCIEIDLDWYGDSDEVLRNFSNQMRPNNKVQLLSEEQLEKISLITNHTHDQDYYVGYLRIEQHDEPRLSKLTNAQKDELARIFASNKKIHPDWFKALAPFAQNALKKLLKPDGKNWNWNNYEKCHPTILRHMLGEANATTHRFKVTHVKINGEEIILSDTVSIRQGAPTSFNMKNKNERVVSAKENLKQMLSDTAIQSARANFKEAWGISDEKDDTKFPLPVVLVGLLTPATQAGYFSAFLDRARLTGGESNTLLTREKNAAFSAWHNPNDKTIQAFNLNVGVNWQRDGVIQPDEKFILFVNQFNADMFTHLQLNKHNLSVEKWSDLKRKREQLGYVKSALNALDGMPSSEKGRNENLYTAALYDVAARLMYGLDTGNCKSSKDRKGVEFIMADAMLAYLAEKEALGETLRLPGINDKDPERARFIEIFCELYASGHQLLLAHDNSPGCPGIKDEGILDEDIKAKLNEMRMTYAQSKKIAHLNKPGTFWKTHGSKIIQGTMMGGAAILGVASIACMVTGILSPLGILGGAAATQLGAAALSIGWAVNIAIPMAGGAGLARLCCGAADIKDAYQHKQGLFVKQITRKKQKDKTKNSSTGTSTSLPLMTNPSTDQPTSQLNATLKNQTFLSAVETKTAINNTGNSSKDTRSTSPPLMTSPSTQPTTPQLEIKIINPVFIIIEDICEKYLERSGNIKSMYCYNEKKIYDPEIQSDPKKIKEYLLKVIRYEVEEINTPLSNKQAFFKAAPDNSAIQSIKKADNKLLLDWLNIVLSSSSTYQNKFSPPPSLTFTNKK